MPPESFSDAAISPRMTRIKVECAEIQMFRFNSRTDGYLPIDIISNGGNMICVDINVDNAEKMIKHLQDFVAYAKTETIEVPARHAAAVRDFIRSIDR